MCGAEMTEAKRFTGSIVMLWADCVVFRWLTGQLASIDDGFLRIACQDVEEMRRIDDLGAPSLE